MKILSYSIKNKDEDNVALRFLYIDDRLRGRVSCICRKIWIISELNPEYTLCKVLGRCIHLPGIVRSEDGIILSIPKEQIVGVVRALEEFKELQSKELK